MRRYGPQNNTPAGHIMNALRLQRRLSSALRPVSAVYGGVMRLREKRYAVRFLRGYRAGCPVLSVGNISWGGTGKTPIVDWLLGWAEARRLAPVVLTRGYGGKPPALPFRVNGSCSAAESGDEPLYLSARHPGTLVLVDPKRSRAAAWAEKNAKPDLFILDDGMQHMAMGRDLDLVLLRPDDVLDDWNKVIPAGPWRESGAALHRADAFLLRADPVMSAAIAPAAVERLASLQKPLFFFHLEPSGLRRLINAGPHSARSGKTPPHAANLDGADYVLTCAVGQPGQVAESASALLGKAPAAFHTFPDHHAFTEKDAEALAAHGLPVVCTGKDAVKLLPLLRSFGDVPVWEMEASVRFGASLFDNCPFPTWWENTWASLTRSAVTPS